MYPSILVNTSGSLIQVVIDMELHGKGIAT